MKRFVVAILILTLIITTAIAEDYSSMTIEELQEVRDEKIKELSVINSLIATMHSNQIDSAEDIDSVSIGDLFPDKTFAEYIRDTLGKTSIHDAVTQDDLDTITKVRISYNGDVSDLTGISHLRNLTSLSVTPYKSSTITDELLKLPYLRGIDLSYYSGTTLPDWFTQMSQLEWLEFAGSSLVTFPDDIGNLGNLTYIMLNNSTDFTDLPESIGNCVKLESLYLGNTGISSIPSSLGNCINLTDLELGHTSISEIPQSILDLNIERLGISNTNIE